LYFSKTAKEQKLESYFEAVRVLLAKKISSAVENGVKLGISPYRKNMD
jgi:hypothetical protein